MAARSDWVNRTVRLSFNWKTQRDQIESVLDNSGRCGLRSEIANDIRDITNQLIAKIEEVGA